MFDRKDMAFRGFCRKCRIPPILLEMDATLQGGPVWTICAACGICRVFHTLDIFLVHLPHVPSRHVGTPRGATTIPVRFADSKPARVAVLTRHLSLITPDGCCAVFAEMSDSG